MKRIVSLLLTAVLLTAMLSVFVLPASAEEEKTAAEYMSEAAQLENAGLYDLAAGTYYYAASLYQETDEPALTADAYMKAGECYEKAECFSSAGSAFDHAASQYEEAGDSASATNAYKKAGAAYMKDECGDSAESFAKAGDSYLKARDYAAVAYAYMKAGECYLKTDRFSAAAYYFSEAASAAREKADESTGSTLSEGSLTIICTVAAAVVFGLGGFFLGRKKKPALADVE